MKSSLQGRNLAHFGCLIGLIIGLSGGIVLAWALILHNVSVAFALGLWIMLTVFLGLIGFFTGNAVSTHPSAPHEEADSSRPA